MKSKPAPLLGKLCLAVLFALCLTAARPLPATTTAEDSAAASLSYLREVMDQFHNRFPVYDDVSSAGNHFHAFGQIPGQTEALDIKGDYSGTKHSGATSIRCIFDPSKSLSGPMPFAGYYFQNGILSPGDLAPKTNFGEVANAGVDLTGATALTFWARGETGQEVVEFFMGGVGRNANTGLPTSPYPDSTPRRSTNPGKITLSTEWRQYTIDLTGADLSYVLGGFGWVASTSDNSNGVVFYLDDIEYELNPAARDQRLNQPRFLRSFTTLPLQPDPFDATKDGDIDFVLRNNAFAYDNALALLAFLAEGSQDGLRRARLIGDAFRAAAHHDRFYDDDRVCGDVQPIDNVHGARIRSAYAAGDISLPHGWRPNMRDDTVPIPGFYVQGATEAENQFYEVEQKAIDCGNNAWAMIALLALYQRTSESAYLDLACKIGHYLRSFRNDAGLYQGFLGGTATPETNPMPRAYASSEHNLDIYAAFSRMFAITGDPEWQDAAEHARAFVESMWDSTQKCYLAGTTDPDHRNAAPNQLPLDVQAWSVLSLPDTLTVHPEVLRTAETRQGTTKDGYTGFDFNEDQDGVWFEGTGQMAVAYAFAGEAAAAERMRETLRRAQYAIDFGDRAGLPASSRDALSTGFKTADNDDFKYFRRLHVGATAWNVFAQAGFNPYYQSTAATPPVEIAITTLPEYGSLGSISGTVTGVDFTQYRVAPLIYVPGLGWYTKPTYASPTVAIDSNGHWSANVTTGGAGTLDPRATIYGAWLVPAGYNVPLAGGAVRVPAELDAYPHATLERFGPTLQFAGQTWAIKDAFVPVGPGSNRFSTLASDISSDGAGLHLTLHDHDGYWWNTEVTLLGEELNYGTYYYQTNSRTDNLDVNVTFGGGFIFDDYGDEISADGSANREVDLAEDSRWGVPTDPNTQNTKQPYNFVPDNRHRFNLPDLSSDPALTRILIWKPDSLHFITLRGHYLPTNYPPEAVVNEYIYTNDPAAGRYVPLPGRERFHFNLWLNKTVDPSAPSDGQPVEVIINDFGFTPDPEAPVISGPLTATAVAGQPYSYQINTNGAFRFDAAGLPPGLQIGQASGVISGTPTALGTSSVLLSATNTHGKRTATLTLTVAPNVAPSFSRGPDQRTDLTDGAQSVPAWATLISAGPAYESAQTLDFVITSNSAPALFSALPAVSPTGTLTYTPAADVTGTATISVALHDSGGTALGGVDQSPAQSFTITITRVATIVTAQSGPVPGAGLDPRIPADSEWRGLGPPSITAQGTRAGFLGNVRPPAPGRPFTGIFSGPLDAPALQLKTGDAAVNSSGTVVPGVKFASFTQPVFAEADFALPATVSGAGITSANDTGLWASVGGVLRQVARVGAVAPGANGGAYRAFVSLAMPAPDTVFFVATLNSPASTDTGLWRWSSTDGAHLLLRKGGTLPAINGTRPYVASFQSLYPVAGSPGHARYDSSIPAVDVLLTLTDSAKTKVVGTIGADGLFHEARRSGTVAAGRRALRFGMPSSPGQAAGPVERIVFQSSVVPQDEHLAILDSDGIDLLALAGQAVPEHFVSFGEPVAGYFTAGQLSVAFTANLSNSDPLRSRSLWAYRAGHGLELVARAGDSAGAPSGTKWHSFTSIGILEGRGPIFTATLQVAPPLVTAANNTGLWATDSANALVPIVRTGDILLGRKVQSFFALAAVASSPGQRRTCAEGDVSARVIYRVNFTDGTSAILSTGVR